MSETRSFRDLRPSAMEPEYVAVDEHLVARKPKNISFEEAASIPLAGLTAWEAINEVAHVSSGQKVLIHGGAGGVGIYLPTGYCPSAGSRMHSIE